MRIIAGDAKGRKLLTPSGRLTRPTSDRVKESLFNILGSRVPDARVLDLFAGTGNLGLEAISRGAQFCIFVDNNKDAVKLVRENIAFLKYEDYCEVYNNDAIIALDILGKRGIRFDIIFLDPPYKKDLIPVLIKKILETDIIEENCIIAAEHDLKDETPEVISGLNRIRSVVYGNTAISFYRKLINSQ